MYVYLVNIDNRVQAVAAHLVLLWLNVGVLTLEDIRSGPYHVIT